jgi:hypothetical protein
MSQSPLPHAGRAFVGAVEAFLILHGGLNLVSPTSVALTLRVFAVSAAVVMVVLLVGARLGWVRRTHG